MKSKTAIITGSGSGIGRGIAQRLARDGYSLALIDINESGLNETSELIGPNVDSLILTGDVSDEQAVKRMVGVAVERFGSIDALVTVAGVNQAALVVDTDLTLWNWIINTNLTGTFLFCREIAPHMMKQRSGRIVTMSSILGKEGHPLTAAYCASKFAINGFTESLGAELGPYGITVNAVCPGPVDTIQIRKNWPERAKILGITTEEYAERHINSIALRRMNTAEDVAGMVAFLLSPDASYITRLCIDVAGGMRAVN